MDDEQRKQAIVYANALQYMLPEVVPGEAEIDAILKPDDSMNVIVIWRSPDSPPTEDVIRSTFKISAEAVATYLLSGRSNFDRFEKRLGRVIVDRLTAHKSSVTERGKLVIFDVGVEDLRA